MWWWYVSYSFLDASDEEYQEEEEVYFQGEEDHFDQFPNQGKIMLLQSAKLTMSKALPHLFYVHDHISKFYFTSFITFVLSSTFWFMIHLVSIGLVQEYQS